MFEHRLKALTDYIDSINKLLNIQISITDNLFRFMYVNDTVKSILIPYTIHGNKYCVRIKSVKKLWYKCMNLKELIYRKFDNADYMIYGMCYAGVEEYIMPVKHEGKLIALVHAGPLCSAEQKSLEKINAISNRYGINRHDLEECFFSSVNSDFPDYETMRGILGVAAQLLADFYSEILPLIEYMSIDTAGKISKNYILTHAVEYIKNNYRSNIKSKDICNFCHCSNSQLSHIFKKNMHQSISEYINTIRIAEAKKLLAGTGASISKISSDVGFNDSNYFSKVFTKYIGVTPTEYRKQKGVKRKRGIKET